MNPERLSIFISSCEKELVDERQIAIATIKKMGFSPLASEDRPASDEPIEKLNEGRVSKSNIYVGIFGKEYSKPTIDEYYIAIDRKIPPLVFRKKEQGIDDELRQFVDRIKSSSSGNTYTEFDHVVEFQKELKKSIIYLVSRDFRRPYAYDTKESVKAVKYIEHTTVPTLGTGKIIKVDLPPMISIGQTGSIHARVEGKSEFSFLDLMLVDSTGKQYWYPNPTDIDQTLDKGIHTLEGKYEAEWKFEIYQEMKAGSYIAFTGIYEDTYNLPTVNRRLIAYDQQSITIQE
jgi:hypothetical protein